MKCSNVEARGLDRGRSGGEGGRAGEWFDESHRRPSLGYRLVKVLSNGISAFQSE